MVLPLLPTLPRSPPCTRVCTCAVRSGRHVLRAAAVASVRSANAHAQVIDNGLDLLMITPLERM